MILGYASVLVCIFLFIVMVHHCWMYDNLNHQLRKLDREIYAIRNEKYFKVASTIWSSS